MTLSERIDETRPKSPWRSVAGVFVVTTALAAFVTMDGDLFGFDLGDTLRRILLCGGIGLVASLIAVVRIRRRGP